MKNRKIIRIVIPLIIILFGAGIMSLLIARRPEPKKNAGHDPGVIVQVVETRREDSPIVVRGTGTVQAAQEVSLIPQVNGIVTYVSPRLRAGGMFSKGEVLFRIEEADYRLALERAKASKARAEYDLATIESQARIARAEWDRLGLEDAPPNPLVLYEPQLRNAQAELQSARASVEQARLNLERTRVTAPFNGRIRSENIDLGQYVTSGSVAAVLAGTDSAEIVVPLSLDDLHWLSIPGPGDTEKGSKAIVQLKVRENPYEWKGHIVRSTGEVETKSRMMPVVVRIDDPYGRKDKDSRPALAVGSFVDVLFQGRMLSDVVVIPRKAFRDESTVWIMDENDELEIRKVTPLAIKQEEVIIGDSLADGERLIVTNISGAVQGMKLRISR